MSALGLFIVWSKDQAIDVNITRVTAPAGEERDLFALTTMWTWTLRRYPLPYPGETRWNKNSVRWLNLVIIHGGLGKYSDIGPLTPRHWRQQWKLITETRRALMQTCVKP